MNGTINTIDIKETLLSSYKNLESDLNRSSLKIIKEKRENAFSQFEKTGFPTTKNEEWKYTNIAPALKHDYSLEARSSLTQKEIEQLFFPNVKANAIVFINGKYSKEFSTIIAPESSLIIREFSEAEPEILAKYFGSHVSVFDSFTYLNTAFASNGIYIRIPKGKVVEDPILLYFISDSNQSNVFSQPRNLIVAEEYSNAKIVECYRSLGDNLSFTNAYTEIVLKENAHVDFYKIQNESESAVQVNTTQVNHEQKSTFSSTCLTLGGSLVRNNLNILLNAEHVESTLYGLYLTNGSQHVDNHTLVDHAKPNCYSNEFYKGILDGKSKGVFNGKIFVKPDAQKTNAFQSNKNVLLTKDASMNAKPQLEIFADDVKCSHGATIGQLDKEPVFYLRSRGLSEESAKTLLMLAFANDIIEHIKIEPLKDYLRDLISDKITSNKK